MKNGKIRLEKIITFAINKAAGIFLGDFDLISQATLHSPNEDEGQPVIGGTYGILK